MKLEVKYSGKFKKGLKLAAKTRSGDRFMFCVNSKN